MSKSKVQTMTNIQHLKLLRHTVDAVNNLLHDVSELLYTSPRKTIYRCYEEQLHDRFVEIANALTKSGWNDDMNKVKSWTNFWKTGCMANRRVRKQFLIEKRKAK